MLLLQEDAEGTVGSLGDFEAPATQGEELAGPPCSHLNMALATSGFRDFKALSLL